MKKILLLIAFVSIAGLGFSQVTIRMGNEAPEKQKEVDTEVVRISYEAAIVKDSARPEKSVMQDVMVLQIGKSGISKFYSDNARRSDSAMVAAVKNMSLASGRVNLNSKEINEKAGISSSGSKGIVFKNYPQGKISVVDRLVINDYLYEDPMNLFQWEIQPDTLTILSYLCQKATCDFRGRQYEAWFTPEFPANDGPWKFNGLPGLILKVQDSKKNFVYTAIGIETRDSPIVFPEKNYIKASRQEVAKIEKRFAQDPMGAIQGSMPGNANITIKQINADGTTSEGREVKMPYNPMELE